MGKYAADFNSIRQHNSFVEYEKGHPLERMTHIHIKLRTYVVGY